MLASRLGVDLFVISTDTDYVYLDYKKPTQRPLRQVGRRSWNSTLAAGHFPPGNMGPKIESVLRFLRQGGKEAIITSCENLCQAVPVRTGTHMFPTTHDSRQIETRPQGSNFRWEDANAATDMIISPRLQLSESARNRALDDARPAGCH